MIMGIDPSINCTGICVFKEDKAKSEKYIMIPSKMTKKMEKFQNKYITIIPYTKIVTTNMEYSDKEDAKTANIYNICMIIRDMVKKYKPSLVLMEGVSYGSTGSAALVDLSGLQFAIRITLKSLGVQFKIVSPTSVKKFAVANGQAEKDIMIDAWKRLDTHIVDVTDIKVDDLADSYFIAHYNAAL